MNALPPAARMTMPTRMLISTDVAYRVAVVSAMLMLIGCGAEVAGGAAAVGAMQAKQARQAQAQQAQVVDALKAAQDTGAARAASAAD